MLLFQGCPDGRPRSHGVHPRKQNKVMTAHYRRLAPALLTVAMAGLILGFGAVTLMA